MEKKNNNGVLIGILIGIIIMVLIVIGLFATNTISFNTKKTSTNNQEKENIQESKNENSNNNNNIIESQKIYSEVLEEYKNAIKDENNISNYKLINERAMHYYFSQKGTKDEFNFKYSYFDINKDGIDELLINNSIIDIFSYDGNKIIRLFEDNASCLGERCSIDLYDDGTIFFRGSGGASRNYISFYNINKNTSTLNTINSYYLKYEKTSPEELPTLTVYDEKTYDFDKDTGTKLNYTSEEELLSENLKNTKKIDLEKLTWNEIK